MLRSLLKFVGSFVHRRQAERRVPGSTEQAGSTHGERRVHERRLRELDRRALLGQMPPDVAPEKIYVDRTVAQWLRDGKPGADKPAVQQWLRMNGYGHLLTETPHV